MEIKNMAVAICPYKILNFKKTCEYILINVSASA